jgi:PAS domain S-box-containing protein
MMFESTVVETPGRAGYYLRTLLEDASPGFFIVNQDGIVDYINKEAADIIGFDINDGISGYSLYDIDSVLNCGLSNAFAGILDGSIFKLNEHRCTNRLGKFIVISLFCSPFRESDGRVVGLLGIIQNITDSYKQKSALEEAINELSIMWQVSEALSSATDLDHALKIILTGVTANQGLGFNRAFLFLTDDSQQNLLGKVAVGPRSPEEAGKIWSQMSENLKTLTELLNEYKDSGDKTSFSLSSLIENWRITLNEPSIFRQAIDDRCGLNVFYSKTLSPVSIEILNRLNTDNFAVAPIISKGKNLGLIAADNQITGRAIADSEVQLLQTFANHTALALERSKLYDNIIEHAARLEEKNRQIAESQEQLIRIEKMSVIGELTSSIAHELRNPLTVIGGFANLMLSSLNANENSEYLNIIVSEAKRAESVLNQVLDFSRASRTENGIVDFGQIVKSTYDIFKTRLKQSQTPPTLNIGDQDTPVWGNRDQLQHAIYQFMNLTVEEMTDDCSTHILVHTEGDLIKMKMEFNGGKEAKARAMKTLSQIFDSSIGTQKLSIIVAGETIKYHGGSLGIMGSADSLPILYLELPLKRGDV